jgi:hypothetical protein
MQYTPINTILSKVSRDLSLDVDPASVIEWTAEALDLIGAAAQYEEAVAFIEVENHRAAIPGGMTHVIQIARNTCFSKETTCPLEVVVTAPEASNDTVNYVPLDCNGLPIAEYDLMYYRPYYDLVYEYQGWIGRNPYYRSCFQPVRLSQHTFFNTIVCQENSEYIKDYYQRAVDSYTIQDPYFILSFQEGQIAVAYRRVKTDANGYPMVPDMASYREAITRYIRYKMALKRYDTDPTGAASNYLDRADRDWHWYARQSGNLALMPKTLDEHQDRLDSSNYLLPQTQRYYGFFGKMNMPENRTWNGTWFRGLGFR